MKNIAFYLDHASRKDKRSSTHMGNVTAVFTDTGWFSQDFDGNYGYEAIGSVFEHPNSVVASTSVSIGWLQNKGKRISEAEAHRIHPKLFEYLDATIDDIDITDETS